MIKLVSDTINKDDITALCGWLQQPETPRLTKGELTIELEKRWSDSIGVPHSTFVNSGSSAILLLLAAYKEEMAITPKIVVPALSWVTDVSSPMLLGYDIILCDCNMHDLSCDLDHLESIFKYSEPDIFLLVSPLGLIPDMDKIRRLCEYYAVDLIEDVCESLGSRIGAKKLGSFGYASVFSTYYGHHLSTIEGGFISTWSSSLDRILKSMRSHGWSRDLADWQQDESRKHWGVSEFESLYTFYYPGMNVRSTDLQAFIGLRMIDRLDEYTHQRNMNFLVLNHRITTNELKLAVRGGEFISSFAYPMLHRMRNEIVSELQQNEIEVRPLIAGSMGLQPFWIKKYGKQSFPNADLVHKYGFYLPNHQDLTSEDIETIVNIVNKYV
jgi:CDP-6-deoxy-D-xylo-4-hexulose-3-dehydrase